jgi:membrane protein
VRDRLLSFAIVLGVGFLLLVSLVISAALAALGGALTRLAPGAAWVYFWSVVNFLISFGVVWLLFAMIYKWLPDAKLQWHTVWVGAGGTALLFTIGKQLIGLYLGRASIGSVYGAAGSLIVVLVWVYYSGMILFLGAEFTGAVWSIRFGRMVFAYGNGLELAENAR